MLARFTDWLRRQWNIEPKTPVIRPDDGALPFDIDRVAELMESGDPKDFEEIARRMQS